MIPIETTRKMARSPTIYLLISITINIGEQKISCLLAFKVVDVPHTHPIFYENETSDVATRVGIWILTRQYLPDQKWANKEMMNASVIEVFLRTKPQYSCT
jgi:hypothetical protein